MAARTTIYLDDDLIARLRRLAPRRGLNRFIAEAVAEKIAVLERQEVEAAMKEGYLATRRERAELNEDWDLVGVEDWPA